MADADSDGFACVVPSLGVLAQVVQNGREPFGRHGVGGLGRRFGLAFHGFRLRLGQIGFSGCACAGLVGAHQLHGKV